MTSHPDALTEHLVHLRLRNLSPRTIDERAKALRRLARHLGIEPAQLAAVMPSDLEKWQRDISHLSARYRASWHSHARSFFRWCVENGHIVADPSRVLVVVQQPRSVPHPISEADLELAIAGASARIRPWLFLAAYAGLRAAEIASLRRENVRDEAVPPVLVILGKGNKERVVPLSQRVLTELRAHGMPSRGFIFPRGDGKPGANHAWHVSHMANDYLHGLGIPHSLHSLRHRFGTRVYDISQDIRVTQEVLGHATPATTAGYAAYSNARAAAAIETLGGAA